MKPPACRAGSKLGEAGPRARPPLKTRAPSAKAGAAPAQSARDLDANFRAFFEAVGDMIVVADPAGRIVLTNQALINKLGYSEAQLKGMPVVDLHPPEQRREAAGILRAMLRGEQNVCPLPLAAKGGALIPAETRVWRGVWNNAECLFGICKDLSAEQEAQQRFERLFRNNPALMAVSVLPEQTFIDVNDAFIKTLGFSRSDVLGRTTKQLGLFPNPEQQAAAARQLAKTGRITDVDLQVRGKCGQLFDGLFSGEIISSQGRQYFLTVMIDVTARKQVEEADKIRRLNAELEKRVRLRTAQIRHLHAELTLAEQRERSRLSQALHENLQQLLVGAKYLLQDLEQHVPETSRPAVSRVDRILSDSVRVVRNLAVELSPPILRDEGLAATLKWLGLWFRDNYGLAVRVKVSASFGPLSEELSVLSYQAVRELLFNIVKHAQVKSATVTLRQSRDLLSIAVRDEGVGFSPERLPAKSAATTLGLASVRERLALLDGDMLIESAPDQGCRVTLRMPLVPPSE